VVFGSRELKFTLCEVVSISEKANSLNVLASAAVPYSTTAIVSFPVSHETVAEVASRV